MERISFGWRRFAVSVIFLFGAVAVGEAVPHGDTEPGGPAPQSAGPDRLERTIEEAYLFFLGRPSEAKGKQHWLETVRSGRLTLSEAVRGIRDSEEASKRFGSGRSGSGGPGREQMLRKEMINELCSCVGALGGKYGRALQSALKIKNSPLTDCLSATANVRQGEAEKVPDDLIEALLAVGALAGPFEKEISVGVLEAVALLKGLQCGARLPASLDRLLEYAAYNRFLDGCQEIPFVNHAPQWHPAQTYARDQLCRYWKSWNRPKLSLVSNDEGYRRYSCVEACNSTFSQGAFSSHRICTDKCIRWCVGIFGRYAETQQQSACQTR